MANRVTADEVKEIITTSVIDSQVTAIITAANLTVSSILGTSTVLSVSQLKEIERWLSAHLLACTLERQATEEKADGASIKYQGNTGKDLDSTLYGQQVKLLDVSGELAKALSKKKASIFAVTSFD